MSAMASASEQDKLAMFAKKCQALINRQKTLTLSTLSPDGELKFGATPFVRGEDGNFYIYVSDRVHYAPSLMVNPTCSVLFATPEAEAKNLFARERVFFHCQVEEIPKGTEQYETRVDKLQESFGKTVKLFRSQSFFHLLALKPLKGHYNAGALGKAFRVNADGSLTRAALS